jgi:hypothetical protein
MPNHTFRRWTADDIATLKNMAQKLPSSTIAAQLGRSIGATAVKAHQLRLSLSMQQNNKGQSLSGGDPGPAGFDLSE